MAVCRALRAKAAGLLSASSGQGGACRISAPGGRSGDAVHFYKADTNISVPCGGYGVKRCCSTCHETVRQIPPVALPSDAPHRHGGLGAKPGGVNFARRLHIHSLDAFGTVDWKALEREMQWLSVAFPALTATK